MYKRILIALVLVVAVAAGTVTYLYLKPTAEASAPITAIPLEVTAERAPAPVVASESDAVVAEDMAGASEDANVTPSEASAGGEAATVAEPAQSAETGQEAVGAEPTIFEIIPAESEARFIIDEVLNGAPKTVVGVTDQVAGQIAVNPDDAAASQVGIIQINARTLTTDSSMRNRAINNRILFTDDYEFITFTPTAITGMPENISVGEPFNFQVTGDLTVRDTTLPVTFEAEVTPVSETRLEGSANATIRYADFGISIPNVPSVTDVSDAVVLEIDFAAAPVS